jgi:uncharacterized protein
MGYALVTGSSKGIGKAIAIELAKKKIDLLLVARSGDLLKNIAEDIRNDFGVKVDYLVIDFTISTSANTLYDWCVKNNYDVDILVNNAGYGLSGSFGKYSAEAYNDMLQININSLVKLTYIYLEAFKKKQQTYILNIASTTAYQSVPGFALYAASKSFLRSFSRSLSYELRKTNVSVTCVSPGGTDTDFAIRADVSSKALKAADTFNMTAEAVAKIAVKAMFNKKTEVITGVINKLGAFFAWILPQKMVESNLSKIYEYKK